MVAVTGDYRCSGGGKGKLKLRCEGSGCCGRYYWWLKSNRGSD